MKKLFLDMDGVLARFEEENNALERFAVEKGFFQKLQPTAFAKNLSWVNEFENTYILTASPNQQADHDKIEWVKTHLPKLAGKVITVRSGEEKAKYAKGNILIDDYTENLKAWVKNGGEAIKALNQHNGKTNSHKGLGYKEFRAD